MTILVPGYTSEDGESGGWQDFADYKFNSLFYVFRWKSGTSSEAMNKMLSKLSINVFSAPNGVKHLSKDFWSKAKNAEVEGQFLAQMIATGVPF